MTETKELDAPDPELLIEQDAWEAMCDMEEKYRHLVWYVRHKSSLDDEEDWAARPAQIKRDALKAAERIEKVYPDEIESLWDEDTGDWNYGFHSGLLAALRFAMTYISRVPIPGEDENGEPEDYMFGGLEDALEEFPFLDT